FKMLGNRHLKEHGLDAKEYRKKYGFKARQPLVAKSLSAKRSKTAKAHGLGERLQEALQKSRKAKEKPPAEKAKAKAPVKKKAKAKPAKPAQKKVIRRRKKAKTAPA
ncbi:MAG: MucR family transcriptional regulator, partial [Syntrophobacteria bacterium]